VGLRATKPSEVEGVLLEGFRVNKPVLMDFQVDPTENVYPMVPAGGANHQMVFCDPDKEEASAGPDKPAKAPRDRGKAASPS
jgi:acetolactate synthase-1/2/3 large subunit